MAELSKRAFADEQPVSPLTESAEQIYDRDINEGYFMIDKLDEIVASAHSAQATVNLERSQLEAAEAQTLAEGTMRSWELASRYERQMVLMIGRLGAKALIEANIPTVEAVRHVKVNQGSSVAAENPEVLGVGWFIQQYRGSGDYSHDELFLEKGGAVAHAHVLWQGANEYERHYQRLDAKPSSKDVWGIEFPPIDEEDLRSIKYGLYRGRELEVDALNAFRAVGEYRTRLDLLKYLARQGVLDVILPGFQAEMASIHAESGV